MNEKGLGRGLMAHGWIMVEQKRGFLFVRVEKLGHAAEAARELTGVLPHVFDAFAAWCLAGRSWFCDL